MGFTINQKILYTGRNKNEEIEVIYLGEWDDYCFFRLPNGELGREHKEPYREDRCLFPTKKDLVEALAKRLECKIAENERALARYEKEKLTWNAEIAQWKKELRKLKRGG